MTEQKQGGQRENEQIANRGRGEFRCDTLHLWEEEKMKEESRERERERERQTDKTSIPLSPLDA